MIKAISHDRPFIRYALSPLLTLLSLVLVHFLTRYEFYTASAALPFGVMTLMLFFSNIRANLISALLISFYSFYGLEYDLWRFSQVMVSLWPVAIIGGLLRHWLIQSARELERQRYLAEEHRAIAEVHEQYAKKQEKRADINQAAADFVEGLDSNIILLRQLNDEAVELISNFNILQRGDVLERLNRIQGKIVNVAQKAIGWHQLYLEMQEVLKKDDSI
jgi:hypothetical protein